MEPQASGPPETRKDFFVSYNRADQAWAEWIAWQIEEAGYTTTLQAWDFRPGENFVLEMHRAASEAEQTLAVLSPDYLTALYTYPEWAVAFAQDPTGEKGLLVPVRVRECELSGLLRAVVYIDLVRLEAEAAKERLLAGVKRTRAKPSHPPGFPGHSTGPAKRPSFPSQSEQRRPGLSERQLQGEVITLLRSAGFEAEPEVALSGIRADVLVGTPDGRMALIEVKGPETSPAALERAIEQTRRYREETGADLALVVVPSLPSGTTKQGVVSLDQLPEALRRAPHQPRTKTRAVPQTAQQFAPKIFAAMPFSTEYDDTYFVAMVGAARDLGVVCVRADQEQYSGNVVERIISEIRESAAVIADLSEAHPNVLYEVGFAHALGRPTIHICCTPLDGLPFDVSHWSTIPYQRGQTYRLRERLTARLKAILELTS